LTRFLQGR